MLGFLKLITDEKEEPLDDGALLLLNSAIDSGKQMVQLIDDLLNISRMRTGSLKLSKQFMDAKYFSVKIVADYSYAAMQKGIEIRNVVPGNSRIYADKVLFTEVIKNLVTNAIKFCERGDSIIISLADDDKTTVCVRDTGRGIKPESLDKIFKYEEKTSTVGTAGEMGTGLGLPLAMDIMKLHGGALKVESEPGKGSLFSLKLPYVRPRILIVDDDASFRALQIAHLEKMKVEIFEAPDGRAALEIVSKILPHLVITDIKMPVMDGLELLKELKDKPETMNIPVIMVSGEYGMEIRDTVFKLGAEDFVTKPYDPDDFIPRVRRFVG